MRVISRGHQWWPHFYRISNRVDEKNYWRVRQIINTERRFDYLETICLICVNHFSNFCACPYLLKNLKNYGKSKQICRKFAKLRPTFRTEFPPLNTGLAMFLPIRPTDYTNAATAVIKPEKILTHPKFTDID